MPAPEHSERVLIARLAANERWANEPNRTAATAKARKAFDDRFAREADPDGVLSPAERAKRAENLRQAFYARLALKSAQARRARRKARELEAEVDDALSGDAA